MAVESIEQAIAAVRRRVAGACERSGRDPRDVTVIGAAKTMPAAAIAAALRAGLRDIGENRVQEALPKIDALSQAGERPAWHFLGHLQRNKARAAAGAFDVIHSVDSEGLMRALDMAAKRPVECFLQVNVAGDEQKHGVAPGDVATLLRAARECRHLRVTGLMTIGRLVECAEDARVDFRALKRLAGDHGLANLSMGMTGDFEVAIEEGATHVRIGRAIFGEHEQ